MKMTTREMLEMALEKVSKAIEWNEEYIEDDRESLIRLLTKERLITSDEIVRKAERMKEHECKIEQLKEQKRMLETIIKCDDANK